MRVQCVTVVLSLFLLGAWGAGSHADVKVRVLRQALVPAVTGTQDFLIAGFGTPKGALLFLSSAVTSGTAADHALFGIGATDCTAQWVTHTQDLDGLATAEANRQSTTTAALQLFNTTDTAVDLQATASCIPDGIRLNLTLAASAGYLVHVLLFGGSDVTTKAGTFTSSAALGGTVTVSTVGFLAQDVFALGNLGTWTNLLQAGAMLPFGLMTCGGGQGLVGVWGTDAVTTPAQVSGLHTAWMPLMATTDFPGRAVELSGCSPTGFTVTTRVLAAAATFGYFAITYNGTARSWVGRLDTPATPQEQAYTGPGWRPQAALLLLSSLTPSQTTSDATKVFNAGSNAGSMGVGLVDAQAQYSVSRFAFDGAGSINTGSLSAAVPVHLLTELGADYQVATWNGFTSQGLSLNFTTLVGGARAYWAWMLEDLTPPSAVRRQGGVVWLE